METYQPMAIAPAEALRLLKEHPPHKQFATFHAHLMAVMATELQAQAPQGLADRLREWFYGVPATTGDAPPGRRVRRAQPPHLEVGWNIFAMVASELPERSVTELREALAVVDRLRRQQSKPDLDRLHTVLAAAVALHALHKMHAQNALSSADVRLCLALQCLSMDRDKALLAAYDAWKEATGASHEGLRQLARKIARARVENGTALQWYLEELVTLLQRTAAQAPQPSTGAAPTGSTP